MKNKKIVSIRVTLRTIIVIACTAAVAALKEGQFCVLDRGCDSGLHCETCLAEGQVKPRCTRVRPVDPVSKVKDLPFNRYSWLTTHNSYAITKVKSATGAVILSPRNQQDSVTSQLNVKFFPFASSSSF